jgi:CheY-like chemotaxis protein
MSHEIRTPLNGIIGLTELAIASNSTNEIKSCLQGIQLSGDGLLQIVNNVLDFSKIQSGPLSIDKVPFNIFELVNLCKVVMGPKAAEKSLDLDVYAHPNLNCMLLGDSGKLRQVLFNLLSNAIKFTETGHVQIRAELTQEEEVAFIIRFEVRDTGIGMTKEQIRKVIQPFEQASSGTTSRFGGTGLGLAISNQIIEALGGELIIDSVAGVGTKFSFILPFELATGTQHTKAMHVAYNEHNPPKFNGTVLVVEDNDVNQKVMKGQLQRVGFEVDIAENGQIGVDKYIEKTKANRAYSVILMDANMPVMDGVEATKKMRQYKCKTPIVMVSAATGEHGREIYNQAGFTDYLAKPFKAQELWELILKYVKPVGETDTGIAERGAVSKETVGNEMLADVYNSQKNVIQQITRAMQSNDIVTAHRLVHTLKGLASMIGEEQLRVYALAVEVSLQNGVNKCKKSDWRNLETETARVLEFARRALDMPEVEHNFDRARATELLNMLKQFLDQDSAESLNYMSELSKLPETGNLMSALEECDFHLAKAYLRDLRRILEV